MPSRSLAPDRASALEGAVAVFCLVTADSAALALKQAAAFLPAGALVFDGNSCAPETKRENADLVARAGARYVDMAIMAPVHPRLHQTPVLLSGEHAIEAAEMLAALDMAAEAVAGPVGAASSVKMIRSVMVKGLEALSAECLLAARRAGVAERVIDSLERSHPGLALAGRGGYNLERMLVHGTRRAAEMREVVKTLEDLGLSSAMSAASADWQDRLGGLGLAPPGGDWRALADGIFAALPPGGQPPDPRNIGTKKKSGE